MFPTQGFTEIVFCAVTSNEQVKVQFYFIFSVVLHNVRYAICMHDSYFVS